MRIFDRDLHARKGYWNGTHRTCSPAVTLAKVAPRMREFGVTRLADLTGLDHVGLPVFAAIRPNSRSRSVFEGKGADRPAARASALMEAIEGWHAERVELPLRHESFTTLRRREAVLDVDRLALYPGAALRADVPMLWAPGYDLVAGGPCWVPFECVTTNCVPSAQPPTFGLTSNGLASGNHLLEAIVHALCELIERDSCSLWQLAGGALRKDLQLDLSTVTDPAAITLLRKLRDAGLEVALWETTSDTGVPAFECQLFERPDGAAGRPLKGLHSGQGCHLHPTVALMRALTEAIQSRIGAIAGARDDLFEYLTPASHDELRVLARALDDPPPRRPFPHVSHNNDNFEDDVEMLVEMLVGAGIEQVAVVDLTHDEVGIPVAKVIVPDLERARDPGDNPPGERAKAAARGSRAGRVAA